MRKKGFTLIELIVIISILGIISSVSAGMMVSATQLFIYLPREMRARAAAADTMEAVLEGEPGMRGLRYAISIQAASATQVDYTFGYPSTQDQRKMRFRWDSIANKLYRSSAAFGASLDGAAEEPVPYYAAAASDICVRDRPSVPAAIFSYIPGAVPLSGIKRVEVNMRVTTGTGVFSSWQGSFETTSGVEIKQYT